MRITVIGATGGIGRQIVAQGLDAGHEVIAAVRNTGALAARPRLTVHGIDIFDADALAHTIDGSDAVLSALGPRPGDDTPVIKAGAQSALDAMAKTGVRRLIIVSANGAFVEPGDGLVTRFVVKPILGRVFTASFADVRSMESIVRASDVDWTLMRPPRLQDKPVTGRYRTAIDRGLARGMFMGRPDVAHAMLALVEAPVTYRHFETVAY